MNIYAKRGDKVKYLGPTNGYDSDKKHAESFLRSGQTYTVKRQM